jgi:hypothetical protein
LALSELKRSGWLQNATQINRLCDLRHWGTPALSILHNKTGRGARSPAARTNPRRGSGTGRKSPPRPGRGRRVRHRPLSRESGVIDSRNANERLGVL